MYYGGHGGPARANLHECDRGEVCVSLRGDLWGKCCCNASRPGPAPSAGTHGTGLATGRDLRADLGLLLALYTLSTL